MRDVTQLHPDLQKKAKELVSKCEKQGLKIKITECLRTIAEQDALYAQGRTKPGKIVTNAKGSSYSSMHQWGVAFDFCRNDGGDWKSIKDKPHFQLKNWGSTPSKLKSQYKTPEKFFKTWNTSKSTKTETAKKTTTKPKTETKEKTNTTKYKVAAKSGLWIRKEPNAIANKIIAMPNGSIFVSDRVTNDWAHGTWNGNSGWSSMKYLKKV